MAVSSVRSEIVEPALWQFRAQLLHDLSSAAPNPVRLAKAMQTFVDEAGKEASERRERLRTDRGLRGGILSRPDAGRSAERRRWRRARCKAHWQRLQRIDLRASAIDALDACLRAIEHVDRNANLGLVIQRWCEEIAGHACPDLRILRCRPPQANGPESLSHTPKIRSARSP